MDNFKKIILTAFGSLVSFCSFAQSSAIAAKTETGFMRSEGKIYVVMIVVITILAGLLLYVLRLDKKITKLEKGA